MTRELTPRQAAVELGANLRSVQRWIATGRLPARRVGGRWRVANDALERFAGGAELAAPRTNGATRFRTLFIANRGEIAQRIARTCRDLRITAVVPDVEGPNALDLLDVTAVVSAARTAAADCVHPGFGFLAENAAFAEAVEAAGIAWIGPPPGAIRAMGDKAAARQLAAKLGIPVVPGYDGAGQRDRAFAAAAPRLGFPLLVKPAAGGGGKGMRAVRDPTMLRDALASARREAAAAFGDDRLILERLVEGARHVEVQVLFDRLGGGVHLGERDCSIQRRHQKILEETPSPAVGPKLRRALTQAALTLASAVGYVSAGTCEFLVDARGNFFFLETNTRLQVEHPVTELVTGRDLVADQIRIAAGEPLGFDQADLTASGDAIEVRLYAEDPEDGFLPAIGRVELVRWPAGDGVRVDAGIAQGDEVGGRFDPMLAKIVAHGRDRQEALARLTRALDDTLVLGLVTNLRFLRWLVRQPAVVDGLATIDALDRIWPPDDWQSRANIPDEAWQTAAMELLRGADESGDGWRLNGAPAVRLGVDGAERTVRVRAGHPVPAIRAGGAIYVDVDGRSVAFRLAPPPDVDRAAQRASSHGATGTAELTAPMPGAVLAVHAKPGATVEAGDPIVTLEAMKMEHVVAAPAAGRVANLLVDAGDQVSRGQQLATIVS
jgi:acetyl-CoA/propionyl-CoA carboxylase biotin carboxyl carrier protein